MSRRFLITLWPFTGHLLPQISIAMALRERGHEVAFYSGGAVRETRDGRRVRVLRLRPSRSGARLREHARGRRRSEAAAARAADGYCRSSASGSSRRSPIRSPICARCSDAWQPDVIATDLSLWGPIVVLSELEPVPVALSSTFMGPLIPGPGRAAVRIRAALRRAPRQDGSPRRR